MSITKEQQQAIEEAATEFAKKCDPMNETLVTQAHLRMGYLYGAQEVLNNPEKYGLVNWQRGGNTVIPTVEYKKMMEDNQWISVKDRLPEEFQCVWVHLENGATMEGYYSEHHSSKWYRLHGERFNINNPITHWMLPTSPKNILK